MKAIEQIRRTEGKGNSMLGSPWSATSPASPISPPSSSSSSHALDETFGAGDPSPVEAREENEPPLATYAMPADEIAPLRGNNGNLKLDAGDGPEYADVAGQEALKVNDRRADSDHSLRRFLLTLVRGRAMPLRSLTASVFWCVAAVVVSFLTRRGYPPHDKGECRRWCTPLAVDGGALSYVGFALFLLTSFRVQEAYGRYMEAARVWTNIGGTITSFAQYVVQAFPEGMLHRGDRERILSFLVAFPVALKRELRRERDLSELKNVLTKKDLAHLQSASSMSGHCLFVLSGYMLKARERESHFPQTFIVHLIRWIADLAGAADVCLQINTMPAPYSYITHLNTFLALWLFFLPFAIVEFMGWFTIPIVTFISYGILGVVCNAVELEDPFGSDYNDLPLGKMAERIQDQVASIFHKGNGPTAFVAEVQDDELVTSCKYWLYSSIPSHHAK